MTTTRNEEPAGLGINGHIPGDGICVIEGCGTHIPENALMCREHWLQVPRHLQDTLRAVAGRWARGDAVTLSDVRDAQWACVEAIS